MYANYHTHTYLCSHAVGVPEEYVVSAIRKGLKILGFSDHSPMLFSKEHYSNFRMSHTEAETYVNELLRLRKKYKDDIEILIGYEMEYYPLEFQNTINFIKQYPCDYLILGQHYINNEYDGIWSYAGGDESALRKYVNQVIEGIETGYFSYIAHPDLFRYTDDIDLYRGEMRRLCQRAKELSVPLEFNMLGFMGKRAYPCDDFWEVVAEVGNDVIIGSDAHHPEHVFCSDFYESALTKLSKLGITPIKELKLKRI